MGRGGKRPGAGRPPGTFKKSKITCKTIQKQARFNETEIAKIESAARIQGKDFSKFMREATNSAADRVLKKRVICKKCDKEFTLIEVPKQLKLDGGEAVVCPFCCAEIKT